MYNLKFKTKELSANLSVLQRITNSGNTAIPITKCVLIKPETFYVTNLDCYAEIPHNGINPNGNWDNVCVPCAKLNSIVNSFQKEEEIILSYNPEERKCLTVKTEKGQVRLFTFSWEDMPLIPEDIKDKFTKSIVLDKKKFISSIIACVDVINLTEARKVLHGIQIKEIEDNLRVIGTDAKRLALDMIPIKEKDINKELFECIIPQTMCKLLPSLLNSFEEYNIKIKKNENCIKISDIHDKNHFYFRLIQGQFPNVETVIPTENSITCKIKINKDDIIEGMRITNSLLNDSGSVIKLTVMKGNNKDIITIEANDQESGESIYNIDCEIETLGKDIKEMLPNGISFNFSYLRYGFERVAYQQNKDIIINVIDEFSPIIIGQEGNKAKYIIMPIRKG